MFVSGKENNAAILKLIEASSSLSGAVAFIGSDAKEILNTCQGGGRIVCNLKSGGTNPYAVESLIGSGSFEFRQEDSLHAKVYIGDKSAVVSSANMSANGLGLEDSEITGWIEAGFVVDDEFERKRISDWFDSLWPKAKLITKEDLNLAKKNWLKRRINRPLYCSDRSVLDVLKEEPSFFKNRNVYLVFTRGSLSSVGEKKYEEAKNNPEFDNDLDAFEDWKDLPENSFFIDMHYGPRGKFDYYGITKSPEEKIIINFKDEDNDQSSLFLCNKKDDVYGLHVSKLDKEILKNKARMLWKKFHKGEVCLIKILDSREILFDI